MLELRANNHLLLHETACLIRGFAIMLLGISGNVCEIQAQGSPQGK